MSTHFKCSHKNENRRIDQFLFATEFGYLLKVQTKESVNKHFNGYTFALQKKSSVCLYSMESKIFLTFFKPCMNTRNIPGTGKLGWTVTTLHQLLCNVLIAATVLATRIYVFCKHRRTHSLPLAIYPEVDIMRWPKITLLKFMLLSLNTFCSMISLICVFVSLFYLFECINLPNGHFSHTQIISQSFCIVKLWSEWSPAVHSVWVSVGCHQWLWQYTKCLDSTHDCRGQ